MAEATARKTVQIGKQLFRAALRKRLVSVNPFADLSGGVIANRTKDRFVTPAETVKLLEACPDTQWRAIVALTRFGGLRCPSEVLALKWEDIDFAASKMMVHSPKTEHHAGKAFRLVPLFPELLPILEDLHELAEPGTVHVVTRYREATQNLRTTFLKIIKRAGLTPWAKLFQNLRSSRETELAERFPVHVAAAWIGNSTLVAARHYLQVTDAHFGAAVETPGQSEQPGALQNAVQQTDARACKQMQEEEGEESESAFCASLQGFASDRKSLQNKGLGVTGLEPVTSSV
ncbi:MAG: tyrosine-type recombinase/integrase [Phycisphaerales bacterium]|nr:tyrosine-type recombinase/integrase [Phycisphaerales bacterium]